MKVLSESCPHPIESIREILYTNIGEHHQAIYPYDSLFHLGLVWRRIELSFNYGSIHHISYSIRQSVCNESGAPRSERWFAMDIHKFLQWGTEYFSEYISIFVATLRRPTSRFQPVVDQPEPKLVPIPGTTPPTQIGPSLNPKLSTFLIISIFIGATLNSIIPARPTAPEILTTSVVTLAVWFAYSCFTYGVCKILGGNGSFWETVSVSLQLLAVIYVVSNFTALLLGATVQVPFVYSFIAGKNALLDVFIDTPIFFYYVVQIALMFIYLPLALKNVHDFRFAFASQILIGTIPVVGTLCAIGLFMSTSIVGVYTPAPSPTVISTSKPTETLVPTPTETLTPTPTETLTPTPTFTFGEWIVVIGKYSSLEQANRDIDRYFAGFENTYPVMRDTATGAEIRAVIFGFNNESEANNALSAISRIRSTAYVRMLSEWCISGYFFHDNYIECSD